MKKLFYLVVIVLSFILLFSSSCRKDESFEGNIPVYTIAEPIINPPDTFRILYQLVTSGDYIAEIQFETNAVWNVERLSLPGYNTVWAKRTDSTNLAPYEIINPQSTSLMIGFEGSVSYSIIVNRSNVEEDETEDRSFTFYLEFTKLPDKDYDTHIFNI